MWIDTSDLVPAAGAPGMRPPRASLVPAIACGLLGSWMIVVIHEALPVEPGEPWLLAWLRLAAEHPARMACALALVIWAAAPHRIPAEARPGKLSPEELSLPSPFSGKIAGPAGTPHCAPWLRSLPLPPHRSSP